MKNKKIAIIGGGSMGASLARGLVDAGMNPACIVVANPHLDKLADLAGKGVVISSDNLAAAKDADIVVVAVKPWILPGVAAELRDSLDISRQHVAVIVAGVSADGLRRMFAKADGTFPFLTLVMPNTAMSVGKSMTFAVSVEGEPDDIAELFAPTGKVMLIEERLLGAATALASCGIAYALRYVRAAVEGGVELGFRAADAQAIVAQTIEGAAALLQRPGVHAEVEIDKVTTPGGITIRGLNAMEANGFTPAVIAGLKASKS